MKHSYTFLATGSAINLGLGFRPRRVRISNLTAAAVQVLEWDRALASQTRAPGGLLTGVATMFAANAISAGVPAADLKAQQATLLTVATGVTIFDGGALISAAASSDIIPVKQIPALAGDMRDKGTLGKVNGWTLQHSGNRTGKFNVGVNTDYVKPGSVICLENGRTAIVQALTNDGDANNEVTLDYAAPTGEVRKINFYVDLYNAPVGVVMPPGITLNETASLNSNAGDRLLIEAWEDEG